MSDKPDPKPGDIVPSAGGDLTTRSSALVKRGLEALLTQQLRIVPFPLDRSLGNYVIFDRKEVDPLRHPETFPFSQNAKARGVISILPGKDLYLDVKYTADLFTPAEDVAAFSRLRPDDVHTIYVENTYGGLDGERLAFLLYLAGLQGFALSADISDAALVQIRHLRRLQAVTLQGRSDAGLVYLLGLTELNFLDLSEPLTSLLGGGAFLSDVLDAGLAYLRDLPRLQELRLRGRKISDAGFAHIEALAQLRSLDLAGTNIADTTLTFIARMNALEHLDLSYTPVSNWGIDYISRALPNCFITKN
jgi:hypothetical protein